ncbi:MAG: cell envelope integrity protein TolA [Methylobacter sp.]
MALALHLTILGLFALSALFKPDKTESESAPEIIHAEIVDESKVKNAPEVSAEPIKPAGSPVEEKIKPETETNQEAERAIEQEKAEQAKAEAKQAEIAKAKAEAAEQAAKQAEAERTETAKAEAAAQAKVEAERAEAARAKAEAERAEAARMEAEQARMDAEQDQLAIKTAAAAIRQKVARSWIRPVSATEGLKCTIQVRLMPDGTVIDAVVVTTSGDEIFDRSAENAVHRASPLPVPKDKELAVKEFKSFKFLFDPDRSR